MPVNLQWKRDYAASVKRLIHDGVDVPLANLFLHAARANSRLFWIERELAVPFDSRGKMEVDFLCEKSRLVIELDGGQHLGDTEAYRRDRRKEAALQEHGYLVLRFLCEDLGKRLDDVADAILRAIDHQRRQIAAAEVTRLATPGSSD